VLRRRPREPTWRTTQRTRVESEGANSACAFDGREIRPVLLPPGAEVAEDALAVERSTTVRHVLTEIRSRVAQGTISRDDAARQVIDAVESFGLQPVEPPPLLDPIEEDDVGVVVCWMAILASG
jgi:hypothetical protein